MANEKTYVFKKILEKYLTGPSLETPTDKTEERQTTHVELNKLSRFLRKNVVKQISFQAIK